MFNEFEFLRLRSENYFKNMYNFAFFTKKYIYIIFNFDVEI